MILNNRAKCNKCGDIIYSSHRHDFNSCSCGEVSVDGGMDYIRRTYNPDADVTEMSVELDDGLVTKLRESIDWANDTGRNSLGIVCAITRTLTDWGYEISPIQKEVEELIWNNNIAETPIGNFKIVAPLKTNGGIITYLLYLNDELEEVSESIDELKEYAQEHFQYIIRGSLK